LISKFRAFLGRRHNVRAHLWQTLANYTQHIGGIILGIILARILQPSDFGKFAYAQSIVLLAQQPISWNLSQALLATRCQDRKLVADAWHLETWVFTCKIFVSIALSLFFYFRNDHTLALLVLVCGIPSAIDGFTNLLRAEIDSSGNFKAHFFSNSLTVLICIAIGVPLALNGFGPLAIALPGIPLLFLQPILYKFFTPLDLQRPIRWKRVSLAPLRSGSSLWLCSASEQAVFRLDKILLGKFTTPESLGNYNRAYGYAPISHFALSSLYTNPTIAALIQKTDWTSKKRILTNHTWILIPAGIANAIFWYFFADPVVPLVFGQQWRPAIPVFQAMSTLSLCMAAYYLPSAYLFHASDYFALGLIRCLVVLAMLLIGLLIGDQLKATTMALLLQSSLIFTSILLILRCTVLILRKKSAFNNSVPFT
jgi:PST family polysaccharide transporter